jgi:hypothetical protein
MVGFLIAALFLVALGFGAMRVSRYEGRIADAQQSLATQDYDRSLDALDQAEAYATNVQWVPGIGSDPINDVRARKAGVRYWQRKYDELAATKTDAISGADAENVALQMVIANAGFRLAQGKAKDRESAVLAYEEAVNAYLAVLRNSTWNEDVSYNYEYAVRLLKAAQVKFVPSDIDAQEAPSGDEGAPEDNADSQEFKIYVPQEQQERKPGGPGNSGPVQRRG